MLSPPATQTAPSKQIATTDSGTIRLNVQCQVQILEGYLNVDHFLSHPNVVRMDPRRLEFPDNHVDEIYCATLEHMPHPETLAVLQEWYRALKPGGLIQVSVPNIEWVLNYWLSLPETERWGPKYALAFGVQRDVGQVHYTGFTSARLQQLLGALGFVDITTEREWNHYSDHERILAKARKPVSTNSPCEVGDAGGSEQEPVPPAQMTTEYFLNNPLPNVDYDWMLHMLDYPRLRESEDRLREIVRQQGEHIRLQAEQIRLQSEVIELRTAETVRLHDQVSRSQEHAACLELFKERWSRLEKFPPFAWLWALRHLLRSK